MINIKKKINICLLVCLIFSLSLTANAVSDNKGVITVDCEFADKKISKVDVSLSKIADIVEGEYVLRSKYKDVKVDLNNIKSAESLKEACKSFTSVKDTHGDSLSGTTNKDGVALFKDIEDGVYMITLGKVYGYKDTAPIIVSVPSYNEITEEMDYDIKCEPKMYLEEKDAPKTGDNMDISAYVNMAYIGIILLCICFVIIKRYKALDNK